MTLEPWLRRHPLCGYFGLAFGVSWGGILILFIARGFDLAALQPLDTSLMVVLMLLGPSTSGLALTAGPDGRAGCGRLCPCSRRPFGIARTGALRWRMPENGPSVSDRPQGDRLKTRCGHPLVPTVPASRPRPCRHSRVGS